MACRCQRLTGKVAVVTASTDGIGLAIARRLAQEGARVVVSSRKQDHVDATVRSLKQEGLHVTGCVCHVGKASDRKALIDLARNTYGGIDILVSNAAANPLAVPVLQYPEAAWDKIMDVNLKSTFLLIKEFTPELEKRGGGSVVVVSSIAAYRPGSSKGPLSVYGVSKTALLGLSAALVPELSPKNIRINCLAPGLIKTRFSEHIWKNPDVEDLAVRDIPMNRIGEPAECSGAVAFLVSDDASFITGETVTVSGGVTCRL